MAMTEWSSMTTDLSSRLRSLSTRKSADDRIRKALSNGDPAALQRVVVKSQVKLRRKLNKLLSENRLASIWSADSTVSAESDARFLGLLDGSSRAAASDDMRSACEFVAERAAQDVLSESLFQSLVAAELLVRFSDEFTAEQFGITFAALALMDPSAFLDSPTLTANDDCPTVRRLIAGGELPFLLSLCFDSLQSSKLQQARSIEHIGDCIELSSDTDGTFHATVARGVSNWLFPFARIASWSKVFDVSWARPVMLKRWSKCVSKAAALSLPWGFVTEAASKDTCLDFESPFDLLSRVFDAAAIPEESELPPELSALLLERAKQKKSLRKALQTEPSSQSDWAASALLRNSFAADSDIISLDWDTSGQRLNFAADGTQLLHGTWMSRIVVAGKTLESAGEWVCTCWFQDDEVAFAELEAGSADGVRHVRHVMLALKNHFALITETVTGGDESAEIEFESRLNLSKDFSVEANSITRELLLSDGNRVIRAVPVWLADDRVHNTSGDFRVDDGELILQSNQRGGMAVPLLLDWNAERTHRDADWNSLTVTEDRRVNAANEARAFRVRVGTMQLLLFRSLRRGETLRAVLGYNTDNETVYGHVGNSGKIDPLVMVESDA